MAQIWYLARACGSLTLTAALLTAAPAAHAAQPEAVRQGHERQVSLLVTGDVSLHPRCERRGKVICADKTARKLYAVQDGEIVRTFSARFGRPSLPTRNGTHRVTWKDRDHYSSTYHAAMPYSLFFSRGQAIHYSQQFARDGYLRSGSHGCINLRTRSGARWLYRWTRVGTRVVVWRS